MKKDGNNSRKKKGKFFKCLLSVKLWRKFTSIVLAFTVFLITYMMIMPALTIDIDTAIEEPGLEVAAAGAPEEITVYEDGSLQPISVGETETGLSDEFPENYGELEDGMPVSAEEALYEHADISEIVNTPDAEYYVENAEYYGEFVDPTYGEDSFDITDKPQNSGEIFFAEGEETVPAEEITADVPDSEWAAEEADNYFEEDIPEIDLAEGDAFTDDISDSQIFPEEFGETITEETVEPEEVDEAVQPAEEQEDIESVTEPAALFMEETSEEAEEEEIEGESAPCYVLKAEGADYHVTVSFTEEAEIPEGAVLQVEEILPEDMDYEKYVNDAAETLSTEERIMSVNNARFFDITILNGEESVEPKAPVTVLAELADEFAAEPDAAVVHFKDEDTIVMDTIDPAEAAMYIEEAENASVAAVSTEAGMAAEETLADAISAAVPAAEEMQAEGFESGADVQEAQESIPDDSSIFPETEQPISEDMTMLPDAEVQISEDAFMASEELPTVGTAFEEEPERFSFDETMNPIAFVTDSFSVYGFVTATLEKTILASDGHNYKVTVSFEPLTEIPKDAELLVEEIKEGTSSDGVGYEEYVARTENALRLQDKSSEYLRLFDISIVDRDGFKIRPAPGSTVDVSIELADGTSEEVSVVHFADENDSGSFVDAEVDGQTVSFETDGFSVYAVAYTVDFTYEGRTWSFPGRGNYRLADVLAVLGIEGSINDATLTLIRGEDHAGALYLTQVDGEYYINSDIPFVDTYELRVRIGEKVYIITVTDEQESTDLRNFLTKVTVSGAQLQDGAYVVEADTRYTITMTFKERPDLQFENGAILTYQLPTGVVVPEETSEPITIAIVSGGKTYEIPATVTANTNGTITVKFDETDPNYGKLTAATNVSIRVKMDAMFSEKINSHSWGDSIERDIELDTTDHSDVFTEKSGTFDEETGTYHYTIKVRSNGKTTNVNVKDVISGNALTFNNDVRVTGNSGGYTTNALSGGGKGFDYTFAEMQDGEEITITYTASLDPAKIPENGKVTADLTKNTVTVQKEGGDPHTAEYSHQIDLKKPNKSNGNLIGTDADGNQIYSWRIEYNSLALAPAAGDVITDTIAAGSQDYMKYSGNVTVRVYDHEDNEVTGSPRTFAPQSETGWSYTIPSGDTTPYRYVFEYETVVDKEKVNGTGTDRKLANTAGGPGGNDGGEITVGPSDKATITKAVESSDTEKITWVSVLHVPEGGLDTAVVTDRLPFIHTNNLELPGNYMIFDLYKEGSLNVDGLLGGETYEVEEEYDEQEQRHYVIITFKTDGNPGLKANPGGHNITIKLTTEVDQTWLKEGYRYPTGYQSEHVNSININGGEYVDARKRFVQPGLEKKGSELGDSSLKYFKYTLYLSQVNTPNILIDDTFDRSLLEVYDPFPNGDWNKQVFYITGGEAVGHVYSGEKSVKVNYADTETGIHIIANSVPLQDNGEYYPAYMITYFLKLKDGVDLDALARENGGQFDLTNTATWGDHESSCTFTTEYDFLDKKLLKEATLTDRHVQYRITFNPQKSELNGGKDIEMTDTLNENLSVDYTSIQITTEPEGMSVPYSLRSGKDENGNPDGRTIATYIVPDSTALTITYDAMVVGNGRITYKNTVEAKGKHETVEETADIHIEGEGDGATADLNISKVDGNDANIKLEGVQFKLYSEKDKNGDRHDLSLDLSGVYEMILTTDADGVLAIDGTKMRIVMGVKYYLEEIAAPDGYQILSTNPYQFTLVDDMDDVDYSHFVYFYHDTFQIKNYPLEGLVVGKTVESAEAADHTKEFTFEVSILKADGSVDTGVNQKYGDMTFTNGVASFTLKDNQQLSAWDMPEGTKFKVEEKDAEGFTVSTTVGETTSEGAEYTGVTSTDYTLVTFKNKKESETGSLKIKKTVTENSKTTLSDAAKSKLAGTYTFTIYTNEACTEAYKVDGVAQTASITIAADGAAVTGKEITGLPAGEYWIKETDPNNGSTPVINPVKVTVEAGKTGERAVIAEFTNNIETVEKTATKSWSDNNPNNLTIYFKLFYEVTKGTDSDGYPLVEEMEVTGAEVKELVSGTTSVTWTALPKYDANGNEYVYIVKEYVMKDGTLVAAAPDGYVKTELGLTVTNTKSDGYNPKTTYTGLKKWVEADTNDKTRPDSIHVTLYADGTATEYVAQWTKGTGDKANEWTYTFSDLPVFAEDGHVIAYTAVETPVNGYSAAEPEVTPTSYTILDTQDEIRRVTTNSSLDITLAEDTDLGFIAIKKNANTHMIWTQRAATATEQARLIDDINRVEGFIGEMSASTVVFVSGLPIERVFEKGSVTVTKTTNAEMHVQFVRQNQWAQICYGSYKYEYAPGTTSFTNTLKTTEYIVNKNWGDGQQPPEGAKIQFKLNATVPGKAEDPTATPEPVTVDLADIGVSPETITLNGGRKDGDEYTGDDTTEAPWKYEWTNLPQYDKNRKLISYSAAETSYTIGETTVDLEHYPASASGDGTEATPLVITNRIPKTSIKVLKTWAGGDQELPDGTSVTLELSATVPGTATDEDPNPAPTEYALPESTKTTVVLNGGKEGGDDTEENPWKYEWKELPEYDQNGKKITYAVTEAKYTIGTKEYETGAAADTTPVEGYAFSFTNTVPTEINILKVDKNNKALTGAKFLLKRYTDNSYKELDPTFVEEEKEVGSDEQNKGKLKFENLTAGHYELVETQAPSGYVICGDNPRFKVEFDEAAKKLKVNFTNTSDGLVSYDQETNTFTVINEAGVALPRTGGIGTMLFTALGGLMTATAGAILTIKRKRKTA